MPAHRRVRWVGGMLLRAAVASSGYVVPRSPRFPKAIPRRLSFSTTCLAHFGGDPHVPAWLPSGDAPPRPATILRFCRITKSRASLRTDVAEHSFSTHSQPRRAARGSLSTPPQRCALLREWFCCDAQTGMPLAEASGAICVQRFDDSRNSAIHITYRISLRSSSMQEPRYPLLRVVMFLVFCANVGRRKGFQSLHMLSGWWKKLGGTSASTREQALPFGWRPPCNPRRVHDEGEQAVAQRPPKASTLTPRLPAEGARMRSPRFHARAPPEALCLQTTNRQRVGRRLAPKGLPCLATRRSGVSGHG